MWGTRRVLQGRWAARADRRGGGIDGGRAVHGPAVPQGVRGGRCSTRGALVEELGEQHRLVAVRAQRAGSEPAGEEVAVGAAPDVDEALLALRALVDPRPGLGRGRKPRVDRSGWMATAVGAHAAAPGAVTGPAGADLCVADRATAPFTGI